MPSIVSYKIPQAIERKSKQFCCWAAACSFSFKTHTLKYITVVEILMMNMIQKPVKHKVPVDAYKGT